MSAWARPGVKCVCIHTGPWILREEADPGAEIGPDVHPDTGEVCTIAGVRLRRSGVIALLIDGYGSNEYAVHHFRPLITRTQEQDVALFRQIIAQVPAGVDA